MGAVAQALDVGEGARAGGSSADADAALVRALPNKKRGRDDGVSGEPSTPRKKGKDAQTARHVPLPEENRAFVAAPSRRREMSIERRLEKIGSEVALLQVASVEETRLQDGDEGMTTDGLERNFEEASSSGTLEGRPARD